MPTSSTSKTPTVSVSAFTADLKAKLAAGQSTIVYVPLEGGDAPTDAELAALLAEGLHVETDVVRDALAVRAATDDEMAAAATPARAA